MARGGEDGGRRVRAEDVAHGVGHGGGGGGGEGREGEYREEWGGCGECVGGGGGGGQEAEGTRRVCVCLCV